MGKLRDGEALTAIKRSEGYAIQERYKESHEQQAERAETHRSQSGSG